MSKCNATTKSGSSCSRNAVGGSDYCTQHAALNEVNNVIETGETAAAAVVDTVSSMTDAAVSSVTDVTEAAKEGTTRFSDALENVRSRINELNVSSLNITPSEFSPENLLNWLKENINRFELPVVQALSEKLEGKTAEDFRNVETWKEIWAIISESIQQEVSQVVERANEFTSPVREKAMAQLDGLPTLGEARAQINENATVKRGLEIVEGLPGFKAGQEFLNTVPGASTVNSLGVTLDKVAPKDLLEQQTWSEFWTVINESLSEEASSLSEFWNTTSESFSEEVASLRKRAEDGIASLRSRGKEEVEEIAVSVA